MNGTRESAAPLGKGPTRTTDKPRALKVSGSSTNFVSKIEAINLIERILVLVGSSSVGEARTAAIKVQRLCGTYGISLEQLRGPSGHSVDHLIARLKKLAGSGTSALDLNGVEYEASYGDGPILYRIRHEFRRASAFEDRNSRERGAA